MAHANDIQRLLRGIVLVAGEVVRLQSNEARTVLRHTNAHAQDILSKLPRLGATINAAHSKNAAVQPMEPSPSPAAYADVTPIPAAQPLAPLVIPVAQVVSTSPAVTLDTAPMPPPTQAGESGAAPSASEPAATAAPRPKRVFRERAVPASPLARVFGFGTLAANMAVGAMGEAVTTAMFGRGAPPLPSTAAARSSDDNVNVAAAIGMSERQAERLAEGLCRMRGAALKIGQMLSLSDDSMLPPQVAKVLERVRTQADIMPRRQLDAVMRAELGPDWKEKLGGDAFQAQPVAAASIGQVHRSTLPDGRQVAIKVQYPGVAESINSDLNNLKTLLTLANFLPKGLYLDSLIAVAREELTAECDYRKEAIAQEHFRRLASDDPDFVVPAVVPELSTRRVLVTTWLEGAPIDCLMEPSVSQDTRNRVARKLLKLTLRELFEWRYMQTDPNWGNFFYDAATERIGLLDFGAAREFNKPFIDDYLRLVWAAANSDRRTIHDISIKLGFLTGYESKVMLDAHVDSGLVVGEPFATREPFDFKASGITARVASHGAVFAEHRLTPPPPEIYSLHRKLAGAFLMCIRLGAVMRCRDLLEETYAKYQFDPTPAAPSS